MSKQDGAFLTIGELSAELGVPHHILRYWESRFPMLRPLQRAGNRRYYRPEDVELARRIHHLLTVEGYTVRGAQQALSGKEEAPADGADASRAAAAAESAVSGASDVAEVSGDGNAPEAPDSVGDDAAQRPTARPSAEDAARRKALIARLTEVRARLEACVE